MAQNMRIYGVGGAGVNIASRYIDFPEQRDNVARIVPALIDTSQSNLRHRDLGNTETYLIEGLDGSGKIRQDNHQAISKTIKEMLVEIPPDQFNVVVFSASGGSGSVIGPLLIKEMMSKGLPVMAIVVGSYESVVTADNTRKTLQSLESVAQMTSTPVVMSYHLNRPGTKRSQIDEQVYLAIACLAVLASGEVLEMDRQDIVNWLNFTKVGGQPQLATLHLSLGQEQLENHKAPVSVASIFSNPDQIRPSIYSDYHTDGYADLSHVDVDEIHYIISVDDLTKIYSEIKEISDEMGETRSARVQRDSIVDDNDRSSDGLVL